MFSVDVRSREPIYEQLVRGVMDGVAKGLLLPDEPLPSVRVLARDLGVNPNTVQKAYRELENRGVIYHAAGRGSFISPQQSLAGAMRAERLEEAKKALIQGKAAGITLAEAMELLHSVYEEGTDHD